MNELSSITRRSFVKTTTLAAGAALGGFPSLGAEGANNKIRLGFIGLGGRGMDHFGQFLKFEDVAIVAAADCN